MCEERTLSQMYYRCFSCHGVLFSRDLVIDSAGDVNQEVEPCTRCLAKAVEEGKKSVPESVPEPVPEPAEEASLGGLTARLRPLEGQWATAVATYLDTLDARVKALEDQWAIATARGSSPD